MPTSTMLLCCAHCCLASVFFLCRALFSLPCNFLLLALYAEHFSSVPRVFLLCRAYVFSAEHISSMLSIFLLCRTFFFSAEHMSSLPSIFLLCGAFCSLRGSFFTEYFCHAGAVKCSAEQISARRSRKMPNSAEKHTTENKSTSQRRKIVGGAEKCSSPKKNARQRRKVFDREKIALQSSYVHSRGALYSLISVNLAMSSLLSCGRHNICSTHWYKFSSILFFK